jgi:hypothetical protein
MARFHEQMREIGYIQISEACELLGLPRNGAAPKTLVEMGIGVIQKEPDPGKKHIHRMACLEDVLAAKAKRAIQKPVIRPEQRELELSELAELAAQVRQLARQVNYLYQELELTKPNGAKHD